jgi:hypothetical protein
MFADNEFEVIRGRHYFLTPVDIIKKQKQEYVYYGSKNNKFYYSRDYAPLGTIVNKTYYGYIGEL